MIYLVEDFFSIQGEGLFSGEPSLFFRFGLCNFRCEGFACEHEIDGKKFMGCDTVFAVEKKHFSTQWQKVEELAFLKKRVMFYTQELSYKPHVVITGGEPLLHAHDEVFYGFIVYLIQEGFCVTIETNASLKVDFERFKAYKEVCFSMSVKLSNSGEPKHKRINQKTIKAISQHAPKSFFKFVVAKENLMILEKEIEEIVALAPSVKVYCMPLGGDIQSLKHNEEDVVQFCLKKGYCYSDRLHIRIWNDKQGV